MFDQKPQKWTEDVKLNIINLLFTEDSTYINYKNNSSPSSKFGISQTTYNLLCKQQPLLFNFKSIRDLIKKEANLFYLTTMDNDVKIERFTNYKVGVTIFDTFTHHDVSTRGKILRQAASVQLDYPGDNLIGLKVVQAIEKLDPEVFCDKIFEIREQFYINQTVVDSKQKPLLESQLKRLTKIRKYLQIQENE